MTAPALRVRGLTVTIGSATPVVEDIDLDVRAGEILGLVGESGSGKSTTALALLGFTRPGLLIARGRVDIEGQNIVGLGNEALEQIRGRLVSYVPQDPGGALNPSLRVRDQIAELIRAHRLPGGADKIVPDILERVGLPNSGEFQRRFPHQLSGGQQQRLAIAMALVANARLIVLDEPTTGLDVVTQAVVLEEIRRLRVETGAAMVYVSHDLAVVASIADRVAVMYAGLVMEAGPTHEIIPRPRHPYTRSLVLSVPDHRSPRRLNGIAGVAPSTISMPKGCPFAPRCAQKPVRADAERPPLEMVGPGHAVRCFEWAKTPPLIQESPATTALVRGGEPLLKVERLYILHPTRTGNIVAAREVSFEVRQDQVVALVGQSGSGKTTIARAIAGLQEWQAGRIVFRATEIAGTAAGRPRNLRQRIQIVSQNATESLNPKLKIGNQIAWPAHLLRGLGRREASLRAMELLDRVRLSARTAERFPAELSGGERQRVAIARALAAEPELLICDEITSALDVSVQAAVLDLLGGLRREFGLSLLFISHDLGVVASIADEVLILEDGEVRERGPVTQLMKTPSHPYTQALIRAAPSFKLTSCAPSLSAPF